MTVLGKQAVVIGAGMGGLAAAGAIADYFERVSVLERDALPPSAAQRAGTPQARHLHVLLASGQAALESLFPGFTAALRKAGAVTLRAGLDLRYETPGFDPFPQRDLGWDSYSMSRPLVEHVARQQLMKRGNVELRERCRVDAMVTNGRAVGAVRLAAHDGESEILPADLVVDASGRGALTLAALAAADCPAPAETMIGVDVAYATGIFAIPEDVPRDWKGVFNFPDAPAERRGAIMMPIEGNCWILTLAGMHGDAPPGDPDGFLAFAGALRLPTIHRAITASKPKTEIVRFAFSDSIWRHFEQLRSFPRGLVPLADAVCRFNPIYGQGMSVAAQEALILRDILSARAGTPDPLDGLAPAFFAAIQAAIDTPWATSAVADFVYPDTRGERPPDLAMTLKVGAALNRLAARDADVHKLMLEVRSLLKPRSVFREPALMGRLMAAMAEA